MDKAKDDLEKLIRELEAEGFAVNGWDDGSIYLFTARDGNVEVKPGDPEQQV
jgi:hypothetical protein